MELETQTVSLMLPPSVRFQNSSLRVVCSQAVPQHMAVTPVPHQLRAGITFEKQGCVSAPQMRVHISLEMFCRALGSCAYPGSVTHPEGPQASRSPRSQGEKRQFPQQSASKASEKNHSCNRHGDLSGSAYVYRMQLAFLRLRACLARPLEPSGPLVHVSCVTFTDLHGTGCS